MKINYLLNKLRINMFLVYILYYLEYIDMYLVFTKRIL